MKCIHVQLWTLSQQIWHGKAHQVSFNAPDGQVTVLPGHAHHCYPLAPDSPIYIDGKCKGCAGSGVAYITADNHLHLCIDNASLL